MKTKAEESIVSSIRLSASLRDALNDKCEEDGITATQFFRDAAEAYVENRLSIRPGRGNLPSYFEIAEKTAGRRRKKDGDPPGT